MEYRIVFVVNKSFVYLAACGSSNDSEYAWIFSTCVDSGFGNTRRKCVPLSLSFNALLRMITSFGSRKQPHFIHVVCSCQFSIYSSNFAPSAFPCFFAYVSTHITGASKCLGIEHYPLFLSMNGVSSSWYNIIGILRLCLIVRGVCVCVCHITQIW